MKFIFSFLLAAAFTIGIAHYNAGNYKWAMASMFCAGYYLHILVVRKEE
jgi:hypothetical protein